MHAVIPSKAILAGIAIFVAITFIVTAIRGNWRLPRHRRRASWSSRRSPSAASTRRSCSASRCSRTSRTPRRSTSSATSRRRRTRTTSTTSRDRTTRRSRPRPGRCARTPTPRRRSACSTRRSSARRSSSSSRSAFYQFPDSLSVDRYTIDGKNRDTVIAVRDLDLAGLDAQQRNWTNDTTVYTHGFGVVAAYGNTTAAGGAPAFWEGGIPSSGDMGEYEPRIYFGPIVAHVLDRRRARGHEAVGARLPDDDRQRLGQHDVPDADGLGRPGHRQPDQQAALRDQVRLRADPVLRPRDERLAGALRPRPARPRREGRAVPDARRPRVPGRRRRPGRVDRRRLHDERPVPVRGVALARERDGRLPHGDHERRSRRCSPRRSTTSATRSRPRSTRTRARSRCTRGTPRTRSSRRGRRCSRRRSSRCRRSTATS